MTSFDSKELLQSQLEDIVSRPKKLSTVRPVKPDRMAANQFNAQLQQMIRSIKVDIDNILLPAIQSLEPQYIGDAWPDDITAIFSKLKRKWESPEFQGASTKIARSFIRALNAGNKKRFAKSVKKIGVVGIDIFGDSPKLQDILSASIADNTRLITSIPEKYLDQVQTIVMGNMRAGLRPSAMVDQLQKQFKITKNRAKLIARDQTSKANGELSKQRQEDTGFKYFKWSDSDDSRVRDRHEFLANQDIGFGKGIYLWSKPPKDENGETVIPGSPINCRCTAIPVSARQVAENKLKG